MHFYRVVLFPLFFLCSFHLAYSQIDSLVNSGVQLQKAKSLSDSGLYDLALKELKRVESRDTNYLKSLSALIDAYLLKEQYTEAIETAHRGLLRPSSLRSDFLLGQAMAYSLKRDFEKAKTIFDAGILEYPFYPAFILQKGKMYYSQGNYEEAEKLFLQALELSPFNSISHLHLGVISMLRGEKVHGMMSMGIYLAINNSSNKQLVLLERFVKNELTDEFSISPSTENAFARLDGILRSRIALEGGYKTRILIEAGVVRQYQLLFDQLAITQEYSSSDPYVKYYLPIYQQLIKTGLQDAFMFHILKSTTFKQVPEWTKKNQSTIEKFYDNINMTMKLLREKKTLPALGYKEEVLCSYYEDSKMKSIGNKNANDLPTGPWYYYFQNGALQAMGHYDTQGKKMGLWKYYNDLGYLTSTENYETGLRERFTSDGKPWQRYYLKNNEVDGEIFIYYDCGAIHEHLVYRKGMRNGAGKVYGVDGTVLERFTYSNDSLEGKYESFYETGEKQVISNYVHGNLHGVFTRYHRNGNIFSHGNYQDGKAIGPWKFYHDNKQVSEEGQYTNDLATGEFRYYDRKGRLIEVKNYNSEGKIHGDNIVYHQGALYYKLKNEDGRMVSATYFNLDGKEIATYKEINGNMTGHSHFLTGEVRSDYSFQNGKATGLWKYYTRFGNVESEYHYANDQIHGSVVEYHPNKSIKIKLYYQGGEKHGPYEEYYSNGKMRARGWYQNGMTQQQWLYYFPNGTIKSDEYFLNDQQVGVANYYSPDGKLFNSDEMRDEALLNYQLFNEQGEQISTMTVDKSNSKVLAKYKSGQEFHGVELMCGKLWGKNNVLLSDGKIFRSRNYLNGKLHGLSENAHPFGDTATKGNYVNGNSEGKWIWYYPGGAIETTGNYLNDERDSVWTYFHNNGTLSNLNLYENGKRNGISKVYGPDGQLILEKNFIQGELLSYRPATTPNNQWIAFSGKASIKINYADGKPALEDNYENGLLHGAQKIYYSNGKLYSHLNYAFGDYEGQQITYYPDGKIQSKRNYLMDNESGRSEWYDATGKIERVEHYDAGFLHGLCTNYQNGKKVKEVKFWYGLPTE